MVTKGSRAVGHSGRGASGKPGPGGRAPVRSASRSATALVWTDPSLERAITATPGEAS
jgi:hypothetical protein